MDVDVAQTISNAAEEISLAGLKASLDAMREAGYWPDRAEIGPLTWEFLILCEVASHRQAIGETHHNVTQRHEDDSARFEVSLRYRLRKEKTELELWDIKVSLNPDVPEGKMWPLRVGGGKGHKPFVRMRSSYVGNVGT